MCFSLIKEKDRSSQSQTMKILLVYSQDDPVDPVDVALAVDGAEVHLMVLQTKLFFSFVLTGMFSILLVFTFITRDKSL